jgi:predicted ATPase
LSTASLGEKVPHKEPPKVSEAYVRGLYLFGTPGCGKTYLMDLFYDSLPIQEKKRVHFNEFMLDVQKEIHRYK